jgi:hypothetical protein
MDVAANQKPRNDEEYVHPDETESEGAESGVEKQHRKNRNRTQAIDVGTVTVYRDSGLRGYALSKLRHLTDYIIEGSTR